MPVFTVDQTAEIQKDAESSGGKYLNPSKFTKTKRLRIFGEAISGYEIWTEDPENPDKYICNRYELKPKELPEGVRVDQYGKTEGFKRFVSLIVWDYDEEDFKILSMTQKTLYGRLILLTKDEDWGEPDQYDIKIDKKGEGKKTEYNLNPVSKKAVSPDIQEKFEELVCDLPKMFDNKDPWGQD